MNTYLTEIRAIDPKTGELKTWAGPEVVAETPEDAELKLWEMGIFYCKIIGSNSLINKETGRG